MTAGRLVRVSGFLKVKQGNIRHVMQSSVSQQDRLVLETGLQDSLVAGKGLD